MLLLRVRRLNGILIKPWTSVLKVPMVYLGFGPETIPQDTPQIYLVNRLEHSRGNSPENSPDNSP